LTRRWSGEDGLGPVVLDRLQELVERFDRGYQLDRALRIE
jgi:hypothetical protein